MHVKIPRVASQQLDSGSKTGHVGERLLGGLNGPPLTPGTGWDISEIQAINLKQLQAGV